ncbi:MAG: SH3 domain-containing protein [Dehalococcoidia bacterium]
MNSQPGTERASILKHPVVLAGLAVVVLLGITAGALIVIDSARGDDAAEPVVDVEPVGTTTAPAVAQTASAGGVRGVTNITTAVRSAPGQRTPVLGTLPRGTEVVIDGRSSDTGWLRIIFPKNSDSHGWVDAEFLDVTGDPEALVVATAEPPPLIVVPTSPPQLTPDPSEVTPDGTLTPEGTLTPVPGVPDLVVGTTPTLSGGKLFITVINQGAGDATGDLVVAVFNEDQSVLLGGATLPDFTLEAGRSIDVGTGFDVTESVTLTLVVDPNGEIEETDNTNNQITISIAIENPARGDSPEAPTA